MRLIVTRPRPAADKTAEKLRQMGHEVEISPLLEIADTGAELPDGKFDALAITSANALRILDSRGMVNQLVYLPVYAVGDATACLARELGFTRVFSASGTVLELGKLISQSRPEATRSNPDVLFACGEDIAGELDTALGRNGISTTLWPLYKANLVHRLTKISADWIEKTEHVGIVLYSPRTARQINSIMMQEKLIQHIENIVFFAISGKAKHALGKDLQRRCLVARSPVEHDIFQLITESS